MAAYLGTLDRADPLYGILTGAVRGGRDPVFHVERLSAHHLVYRYVDSLTGLAVVGKFFHLAERDEAKRARINGEYRNLVRVRALGLSAPPCRAVRPLCREERIGLAVAEEFVRGRDLDHYLRRAAHAGAGADLETALSRLAMFLFLLHDRSGSGRLVPSGEPGAYFTRVVGQLSRRGVLAAEAMPAVLRLRDRWLEQPDMTAEEVLVHGDATPTNFLFPDDGGIVAIDLERARWTDRVYDLGMVCGELKHAFLWRTGNKYAAEPFIRRFLEQYSRQFADPGRAFAAITRRLPYYMGMTELRIARNGWLDWEYRKRLAHEAYLCLRHGLRR